MKYVTNNDKNSTKFKVDLMCDRVKTAIRSVVLLHCLISTGYIQEESNLQGFFLALLYQFQVLKLFASRFLHKHSFTSF